MGSREMEASPVGCGRRHKVYGQVSDLDVDVDEESFATHTRQRHTSNLAVAKTKVSASARLASGAHAVSIPFRSGPGLRELSSDNHQ